MSQYPDLRAVRERLARLTPSTVAHEAGLSLERLRDIEDGAAPSVLEIERLGATYGIDADRLWDEPIALEPGDGIEVLTSLEEYAGVSDLFRARMIQAASAAKDLVTLRRLLGEVGPALPSLRAIDARAARLELADRAGMRLPLESPHELAPLLPPLPSLEDADPDRGVDAFPIARTPLERRGTLARTAARAYQAGKIPRDAFARFLGVTAGEPLEDVLRYFGLELPRI